MRRAEVAAAFLAATLLASSSTGAAADPGDERAKIARGRVRYLESCARCHGIDGRGDGLEAGSFDAMPIDLVGSGVLRKNSDERLAARILNGRRDWLEPYRASEVPAYTPSTDALERFVLQLPQIDWRSADAVKRLRESPGYGLYERHCAACHGQQGRTEWFTFDDRYFRSLAPGELRERIFYMLRGLQSSMPHFEPTLSRADVEAILAYLRTLPADR